MKPEPPADYETGLLQARLRFWREQPSSKAMADRIERELSAKARGVRVDDAAPV